mmetsp:Transcript_69592/g.151941  ORF Transcript_69592/g.151941 Transcript_69592/m.151941 type:complete len:209 (+) Transcript_69592:629-1255(+)
MWQFWWHLPLAFPSLPGASLRGRPLVRAQVQLLAVAPALLAHEHTKKGSPAVGRWLRRARPNQLPVPRLFPPSSEGLDPDQQSASCCFSSRSAPSPDRAAALASCPILPEVVPPAAADRLWRGSHVRHRREPSPRHAEHARLLLHCQCHQRRPLPDWFSPGGRPPGFAAPRSRGGGPGAPLFSAGKHRAGASVVGHLLPGCGRDLPPL